MTPEQLKYSILKVAFSGKLIEPDAVSTLPQVKVVGFEETPFDIPERWTWSTLGNCCEMFTGNSISENVKKTKYTGISEGLDYIATKDVTFENSVIYENGVRIPLSDGFRIAKAGSVLMCIEGGSAGRKIGIIDRDVCFGNKLCMFNSTLIVNKYIFYYLQSNEFKKFFAGNMSGIIGGVSIKKLKELPIPVPSIDEQNHIVAKIEELLPFVKRYAVAYEKLEKFNAKFPEDIKKSILQYAVQGKLVEQRPEDGTGEELYQQIQAEKQRLIAEKKIKKEKPLAEISEDEIPFDIPESWKWVRLQNITTVLGDGIHGTPQYTINGGYYFINGNNLAEGRIEIKSDTKQVDVSEYGKHKKPLDTNTILISINGTIGNYAFYEGEPIILGKSACYFSLLSGVSKEYICMLIKSKVFFDYAKREATQTTIKNVSLKSMRMLPVPLPPLAEQKRIVEKLEELLPLCERLK